VLAPFEPPYMQRALLVMLLLAVLGGCCGVHVVLRRLAFSADVMSHTVFPGVVLAFAWDQSVFLGALAFGLLTAVLLTPLGRLPRLGEDAAMAILLTSLFALGVVVVSKRRTYTADLTAFLFGRVLTIDAGDVVLVAAWPAWWWPCCWPSTRSCCCGRSTSTPPPPSAIGSG
jgi:manganese/iron transport system permease protein